MRRASPATFGLIAAIAVVSMLVSACGSLGGGPRKVVLNEGVCQNVKFLKLNLGETNHVIVDNRKFSDGQVGLTLVLNDFPLTVIGAVPPNSTIGDPYSTIRLRAAPGEQATVDLQPTFTGNYIAHCDVVVTKGAGQRLVETDLTFQLQ